MADLEGAIIRSADVETISLGFNPWSVAWQGTLDEIELEASVQREATDNKYKVAKVTDIDMGDVEHRPATKSSVAPKIIMHKEEDIEHKKPVRANIQPRPMNW